MIRMGVVKQGPEIRRQLYLFVGPGCSSHPHCGVSMGKITDDRRGVEHLFFDWHGSLEGEGRKDVLLRAIDGRIL